VETHDYQGSYTLVAGYMDRHKDVIDFKPDPLFAIKRELKEEIGIEETCLGEISCLGLDGDDQHYLAFVTKLTIPFKKFTKEAAKVKELKKMEEFNLTQKGIENFLTSNYERMTPYAMYYQWYLSNHNNNIHGPNE
ncbi:MAG: NUDIX hydrolase, partial [Candidatus Nitrosopolaris sp.]